MADYPVFSAPEEDPKSEAQPTIPSMPDPLADEKAGKIGAPDMYEKIVEEQSFLGKIASKIPGFSGYIEKGRRREADQIIRDTIGFRLEDERLRLSNVHQDLSSDIILAMDHAEPLGRAESRMMGLINKIRTAPQGYAGFFDAVKIKEEELARIYQFDAGMMDYVDEISADIDALQVAVHESGNISGAIRSLDTSVQEASATFNSRQEILSGVA
jgi:hypothetical protein